MLLLRERCAGSHPSSGNLMAHISALVPTLLLLLLTNPVFALSRDEKLIIALSSSLGTIVVILLAAGVIFFIQYRRRKLLHARLGETFDSRFGDTSITAPTPGWSYPTPKSTPKIGTSERTKRDSVISTQDQSKIQDTKEYAHSPTSTYVSSPQLQSQPKRPELANSRFSTYSTVASMPLPTPQPPLPIHSQASDESVIAYKAALEAYHRDIATALAKIPAQTYLDNSTRRKHSSLLKLLHISVKEQSKLQGSNEKTEKDTLGSEDPTSTTRTTFAASAKPVLTVLPPRKSSERSPSMNVSPVAVYKAASSSYVKDLERMSTQQPNHHGHHRNQSSSSTKSKSSSNPTTTSPVTYKPASEAYLKELREMSQLHTQQRPTTATQRMQSHELHFNKPPPISRYHQPSFEEGQEESPVLPHRPFSTTSTACHSSHARSASDGSSTVYDGYSSYRQSPRLLGSEAAGRRSEEMVERKRTSPTVYHVSEFESRGRWGMKGAVLVEAKEDLYG